MARSRYLATVAGAIRNSPESVLKRRLDVEAKALRQIVLRGITAQIRGGRIAIEGFSGGGRDTAPHTGPEVGSSVPVGQGHYMDRFGNVLEPLHPEIAGLVPTRFFIVEYGARDADGAGVGERPPGVLQCSPVAEDVRAISDDLVEIDADAELDALVGRYAPIAAATPTRSLPRARPPPRRSRIPPGRHRLSR